MDSQTVKMRDGATYTVGAIEVDGTWYPVVNEDIVDGHRYVIEDAKTAAGARLVGNGGGGYWTADTASWIARLEAERQWAIGHIHRERERAMADWNAYVKTRSPVRRKLYKMAGRAVEMFERLGHLRIGTIEAPDLSDVTWETLEGVGT